MSVIGTRVTLEAFYPDLNSPIITPITATVSASDVEFSRIPIDMPDAEDIFYGFTIDIIEDRINMWVISDGPWWSHWLDRTEEVFNGITLTFETENIREIGGGQNINSYDISFDRHKVEIDYDGRLFLGSDGDENFFQSHRIYFDRNTTTDSYEIYRFFNSQTGAHFYTADISERDNIINTIPQMSYENNVFDSGATIDTGVAVHRLYNTQTGTHFYTADEGELASIQNNLPHFNYEGISYYAHESDNGSNQALYRFFNTETGTHFYTADTGERDNIINTLGHFNYEGVAYYVDVA